LSNKQIKDISASTRAKLLNICREKGEDFNYIAARYAVERFLARLAQSRYSDKMILKGAMSFRIWSDQEYRPTRDADFLGHIEDDPEVIKSVVTEIVSIDKIEPDGLVFDPASMIIEEIREGGTYHGKRIRMTASLGTMQIGVQLDIGFGDDVTPAPQIRRFPSLLGHTEPEILIYPKETIIAEKLEAIVSLGMINSRMKDYFDIHFIAESFEFEFDLLRSAVVKTFRRRGTLIPVVLPTGLSDEFIEDQQGQWQAFLNRQSIESAPPLSDVVKVLREFLLPLFNPAGEFSIWKPGGPWTV
jgi:predicted nucleotidyltransferase component of viral defense system